MNGENHVAEGRGEWLKDAGSLALIVAIFAFLLNEVVELRQRQGRQNDFRDSTA